MATNNQAQVSQQGRKDGGKSGLTLQKTELPPSKTSKTDANIILECTGCQNQHQGLPSNRSVITQLNCPRCRASKWEITEKNNCVYLQCSGKGCSETEDTAGVEVTSRWGPCMDCGVEAVWKLQDYNNVICTYAIPKEGEIGVLSLRHVTNLRTLSGSCTPRKMHQGLSVVPRVKVINDCVVAAYPHQFKYLEDCVDQFKSYTLMVNFIKALLSAICDVHDYGITCLLITPGTVLVRFERNARVSVMLGVEAFKLSVQQRPGLCSDRLVLPEFDEHQDCVDPQLHRDVHRDREPISPSHDFYGVVRLLHYLRHHNFTSCPTSYDALGRSLREILKNDKDVLDLVLGLLSNDMDVREESARALISVGGSL